MKDNDASADIKYEWDVPGSETKVDKAVLRINSGGAVIGTRESTNVTVDSGRNVHLAISAG